MNQSAKFPQSPQTYERLPICTDRILCIPTPSPSPRSIPSHIKAGPAGSALRRAGWLGVRGARHDFGGVAWRARRCYVFPTSPKRPALGFFFLFLFGETSSSERGRPAQLYDDTFPVGDASTIELQYLAFLNPPDLGWGINTVELEGPVFLL